ncbi:MAG: DUF1266 domain-containing protein [Clostridiales bacterium]|nr:DUF1266 domain-containing protein [Clostridiales bacterium]
MAVISDNDPIYEVLDKWHDEDEYEKILQKIEEIPLEDRSNKLWFRKISALNNLKRYPEAREEIAKLSPRCSEPSDIGKLFYMTGYIYDQSDCEFKAIECYRRRAEIDPSWNECDELVKDSMGYVKKDMDRAYNAFSKFFPDYAAKTQAAAEKKTIPELDILPYISAMGSSFMSSNLGVKLPLDQPLFKCSEEDKPKVVSFLKDRMHITDLTSLQQDFGKNRLAPFTSEILHIIKTGEEPALDKLNAKQLTHYEASKLALSKMKEFIPDGGLAAWDYSDMLAIARFMYSVDMLSNTEMMQTYLFANDECKRLFKSWEEFTHSLTIGAFYNAFTRDTSYNINQSARFAINVGVFCMQTYPGIEWLGHI